MDALKAKQRAALYNDLVADFLVDEDQETAEEMAELEVDEALIKREKHRAAMRNLEYPMRSANTRLEQLKAVTEDLEHCLKVKKENPAAFNENMARVSIEEAVEILKEIGRAHV